MELKATRKLVNYIIAAFFGMMLFSIALGYFVLIRRFLFLEDMILIEKEESVYRTLLSEKEHIDYTCLDWSVWDDSWHFMRDENPDFEDSNLSLETLLNLQLNLMSFVRKDGSIKWQMEADLEEGKQRSPELPVDFFPERLLTQSMDDSGPGLISIGKRVYILVSEPIVDGSQTAESAGYLILGRELTPSVISKLSEVGNVDFQFRILDDLRPSLSPSFYSGLLNKGHIVEKSKSRIRSYSLPESYPGQSRRIVTIVENDRDLMKLGWSTFSLYLIIALSGVLAVALGVLRYLNRHYLSPVKILYKNVRSLRDTADFSYRIPVELDNEFGRLCESFNSLLDVIQDQTNKLNRRNLYIHEQANTDELTGLFNKRFYRTWLESKEFSLNPDEMVKGSFLMLDIDHFKLYNDRYGHVAGDDCLKTVAELFKKVLTRSTDICCRYGGEEFLLILENTDCRGAECVAERILKEVRTLEIENHDSPTSPYLTVSIGISSGSFGESAEVLDQLILSADKALYASKENGRNRYTVAQSEWLRLSDCVMNDDKNKLKK